MQVLALAAILFSLPALAQTPDVEASRPLTVVGTVKVGPCPGAWILEGNTGERYELDPRRTDTGIGDRATFQGDLYPRISICKAHAWMDVKAVTQIERFADRVASVAARGGKPIDLTAGNAILVVALDQLASWLRLARTVRVKIPASMQVSVGVPASQRELLPKLMEVTRANFDLMKGVQVLTLPEDTSARVIVRIDEAEVTFPSVDALLAEVTRYARQGS
jgi:hypothetical protein